ncbi:MAG: hypothetical protein ACI9KE_001335 [Polyangiales bacterium]|jgi:hypothetical protein
MSKAPRAWTRLLAALLFFVSGALLWAPKAQANGAYTHAHISQLAHGFLPPGELRDLFDDPENVAAFENGSLFPDSGYAISHPYGEFAHWARFRLAFLDYLRGTYGGDYSSTEAQRSVSFFLGFCSHGLADQSYDTIILARAFEVDGPEPDGFAIDQYADYFITIDENIVFAMDGSGPFSELAAVLSESMDMPIEAGVPMQGMLIMSGVATFQGTPAGVGGSLYQSAWAEYPWLGTHIYNDAALGSLPWLGALVAEQWQVLWRRLHYTDDIDEDLVLRTVPEDGGVNWAVDHEESEAYSRIAIFTGYAMDMDAARARMHLRDALGAEVPVTFDTAYGGRERSLIFLRPSDTLDYDSTYTVEIESGVTTLEDLSTTAPISFSFRTRCADENLADCPPLAPSLVTGEMPPPRIPDAGPPGSDAGPPETDAGPPGSDAGPTSDAGGADAASTPPTSSGGCSLAPTSSAPTLWLSFGLALLAIRRRR